MKRILPLFLMITSALFLLCSCFDAEIESISLSSTELSLTVGDSKELELTVQPGEAEVKKLTWTTSDSKVATVDDGLVKAKSEGKAQITVTAENGVAQSCSVTVSNKEIEKIILDNTSTSVKIGKKIQLTASVQPPDAPSGGLNWASSDEKVASVSENGYITGVGEGIAVITCSADNGTTAECEVTVKPESIKSTKSTENESTSPSDATGASTESNKANSKTKSSGGDFILPESSSRKLNDSEVSHLSSSEAQSAINEIYARHGYIFKTKEINDYYKSKSWYSPNPGFSESDLSQIERYNIGLLSKYR